MRTYPCKTRLTDGTVCPGVVAFPPEAEGDRTAGAAKLAATDPDIKDRPSQCHACGVSYYEWEVKP